MIRGIVLLGSALAFTAPALAQYRTDVPAVLTPPPPPPSAMARASGAFRNTYARHGSPRIILFWNRTLSDEVQSEYVNRTTTTSATHAAGMEGPIGYNGYGAVQGEISTRETTSGKTRLREDARDSMAEAADWKVEAAFNRAFIGNGARFVDRAVAMRTTARDRPLGASPNVQEIETSALIGKADLLMEVLQAPDPESPVGYSFRAQVKEVRSGRILASVVNNGSNIKQGPGPLVASSHGFVHSAPAALTLEDVGAALAAGLMEALSARWS